VLIDCQENFCLMMMMAMSMCILASYLVYVLLFYFFLSQVYPTQYVSSSTG
jgi:hypothetical protein